jgi:hypothetical protein
MEKPKEESPKIPHPRKQPLPAMTYAFISIVCLIMGIVLLLFFVYKANDLMASGISKMVFYVLLIPLGLSASGFLFGAMRSYAVFSGNALGGVFELGGPAALFALVIIGGFKLVPENAPFDVTIFVHGSGGKQDVVLSTVGKVVMDINSDRRESQIIGNGSATFKNISAEFRNKTVPVSIVAEGFELAHKQKECTLSNDPIYLEVTRDKSLSQITGKVYDEEGNLLDSVMVSTVGIETFTQHGSFTISIPLEKQQEEQSLSIYKKGYKASSDIKAYPRSKQEIKIILERK